MNENLKTLLICLTMMSIIPIILVPTLYYGIGDCGYYECPQIQTWGEFHWWLDHKHDHCIEDKGVTRDCN